MVFGLMSIVALVMLVTDAGETAFVAMTGAAFVIGLGALFIRMARDDARLDAEHGEDPRG